MSKDEPWSEEELRDLRMYLDPLGQGTGGYAYESDNRLARCLATIDARDKEIAELREIVSTSRKILRVLLVPFPPEDGSMAGDLLSRIDAALGGKDGDHG